MFLRLVLALACGASLGCATIAPRAHLNGMRYSPVGELGRADAARADFQQAIAQQLHALDESEQLVGLSPEVELYERNVPPGLTLSDFGEVAATPGGGFEVLGSFTVSAAHGFPMLFNDYTSVGRKAYCYWQTPLTWVTLGVWMAVPLNYPCWSRWLSRAEGIGLVRAMAKAADANVVVLPWGLADREESFYRAVGVFVRRHAASPPVGASR